MAGVETVTIAVDEAGLRLDRWFRRHYPGLAHGRLEKLLRTGQVRVDGRRVKAGLRLVAGQNVRVPPLGEARPPAASTPPPPTIDPDEAEALRRAVHYRDDEVIALDKPPGLAVQGGTKVRKHLDAMLDALRFGAAERPRLVHRLDKDTSGVLLLGRTATATARLAAAFRRKSAQKTYWALVVGVPRPGTGTIDLALAKLPGPPGDRRERVVPVAPVGDGATAAGVAGIADTEAQAADSRTRARRAVTRYAVIESAGSEVAWLALTPVTGRTHQLRVHCAALGTPILGDGKYGGKAAFLQGRGLSRKLHLHARRIVVPRPGGPALDVTAALPGHMRASWDFFGFDAEREEDGFADGA